MGARFVLLVVVLSVWTSQASGFDFFSIVNRQPVLQPQPRRCIVARSRQSGMCVSMNSGVCSGITNTAEVLRFRMGICSVRARDIYICCPFRSITIARQPTTPRPVVRPRTTQPPFGWATTPHWSVTRPTFFPRTTPAFITHPPTPPPTARTTLPTPAPTTRATPPPTSPPTPPPTARPTTPTSPPTSVVTPPDDEIPFDLRLTTTEPVDDVEVPTSDIQHGFRQPGCGVNDPITAFHANEVYSARPPPFVNAERVALGLHPWTAMVGLQESQGTRWICAGALLTPQIVVTSAQCVIATSELEELLVGLGEHDLNSQSDGVAGTHSVLKVEFHPEWSQPERRHSLALLLLNRPGDRSQLINSVCLPPPEQTSPLHPLLPQPGSDLVEVSYDLDPTGMNDASARQRLAATLVRIAPLESCVNAMMGAPLIDLLFPGGPQERTELCLRATADCTTDVGGPVVSTGPDGTVQLEGIQLLDSCAADQPRLLLRVRHYVPFITKIIHKFMRHIGDNPV